MTEMLELNVNVNNAEINLNVNLIVNVNVNVMKGKGRGCAWSEEEDSLLMDLVMENGAKNWPRLSQSIPGRTWKSCRLRWLNQLSPNVSHAPFTPQEDQIIINAHARLGNKWSSIAKMLKNRTDNGVKNHWNSNLKKNIVEDAGPSTALTLALPYYYNN